MTQQVRDKWNKDIYQNEYLRNLVSFGVHPAHASKSQIEQLNLTAKHYYKNQAGIWYCKYLKVPKIEERETIIENAHLLGHFQLASTFNRIK